MGGEKVASPSPMMMMIMSTKMMLTKTTKAKFGPLLETLRKKAVVASAIVNGNVPEGGGGNGGVPTYACRRYCMNKCKV